MSLISNFFSAINTLSIVGEKNREQQQCYKNLNIQKAWEQLLEQDNEPLDVFMIRLHEVIKLN